MLYSYVTNAHLCGNWAQDIVDIQTNHMVYKIITIIIRSPHTCIQSNVTTFNNIKKLW